MFSSNSMLLKIKIKVNDKLNNDHAFKNRYKLINMKYQLLRSNLQIIHILLYNLYVFIFLYL